jgi:hypothetical protein
MREYEAIKQVTAGEQSNSNANNYMWRTRYRRGQELAQRHRYRMRLGAAVVLGYITGWFRSTKSLEEEKQREAMWNRLKQRSLYGEAGAQAEAPTAGPPLQRLANAIQKHNY